ncbi:MAG: hypothetical protein ABI548_00615 [Polyangiaceae bacterium]
MNRRAFPVVLLAPTGKITEVASLLSLLENRCAGALASSDAPEVLSVGGPGGRRSGPARFRSVSKRSSVGGHRGVVARGPMATPAAAAEKLQRH